MSDPTSFVLAAAQLNLWVGDVSGNVSKIVAAARKARDEFGAQILVCPELSLIGYPPDDLLLRSEMPARIEAGVQRLLTEIEGISVIVGLPEYEAGTIYNSAYVIRDGGVVARARKQLLPNYGVFDERRHFKAGTQTTVFKHNGLRIGLCVCEDIWSPDPAADAVVRGAQMIININASPFDQHKSSQRRRVFDTRVAETGLPLFYVNCVGGQDDVLFDGDSAAVDGDGKVSFSAPLFEEDRKSVV